MVPRSAHTSSCRDASRLGSLVGARGPKAAEGRVRVKVGRAGEGTRWGGSPAFTWLLTVSLPQSLSSTVTLEHSALPPGVHISYESLCGDPEKREAEAGDRGQCSHVPINHTVRAGPDRPKEGSGGGGGKLKPQEEMGQTRRTMQRLGVVLVSSGKAFRSGFLQGGSAR